MAHDLDFSIYKGMESYAQHTVKKNPNWLLGEPPVD